MQAPDPEVAALEAKREAAGITADAMLERASVSASTLWRALNKGAAMQLPTLRKLQTALDGLIEDKEAATTPVS